MNLGSNVSKVYNVFFRAKISTKHIYIFNRSLFSDLLLKSSNTLLSNCNKKLPLYNIDIVFIDICI